MDLFAGKELMDQGITAEALEHISGNIVPALSDEEAAKVARQRMLALIMQDRDENPNRRIRAGRGFANRSEERKAKRTVVAQIRRYHRLVDGQRAAEIAKRRLKKKRANVARRLSNA